MCLFSVFCIYYSCRAYGGFLLLWLIDSTHDGGGIFLAHPAEVASRLCDEHLREEMLPSLTECLHMSVRPGVASERRDSVNIVQTWRFVVAAGSSCTSSRL